MASLAKMTPGGKARNLGRTVSAWSFDKPPVFFFENIKLKKHIIDLLKNIYSYKSYLLIVFDTLAAKM